MKISIDARGVTWYHGSGIGTYTDNLIENLLNIDKENQYLLYWARDNYKNYKRENSEIHLTSSRRSHFFEDEYFARLNNDKGVDIHHLPQNGMGIATNMKCKKITTIHDLIPYTMPETVGSGYLSKFLEFMPKIIKESDGIITVSQYSKKDILKFFPNAQGKVFVTPLAHKKIYRPLNKDKCREKLKNHYKINSDFLLYIGGFSPRKNVKTLIEVYKKLYKEFNTDIKLVITGSLKDDGKLLIDLVHKLNLEDRVIFSGFVPEEDLPLFYNCCEIFIYPSLYEGFGLPPLEAMSCGAKVISSNLTSIPEVVLDSGILIDPFDNDALSVSITNLLYDKKLGEKIKEKALIRSKEFSFLETARKTLDVYKKVYNF